MGKGRPKRATPADYSVHVQVEHRRFLVDFDSDGNVLRIKERKEKQLPMVGIYFVSYWQHAHHTIGNENTWPSRIIRAAYLKMKAGNRATRNTP